MIQSDAALQLYRTCTHRWMQDEPTRIPQAGPEPLFRLLEGLHGCNFYSWKADDRSRGDLDPAVIVGYKRDLDASNLMRNHFMEHIDSAAVEELELPVDRDYTGLVVNSETVGQMLDRMSVLTLKKEFAASRLAPGQSTQAMERIAHQLSYVAHCYDSFVGQLTSGKAHMLAYKQYKMYKAD